MSLASRTVVVLQLAIGIGACVTIAACDRNPTSPLPDHRALSPHAAQHIEGDTLDCRSGWVVVDGRYVCN